MTDPKVVNEIFRQGRTRRNPRRYIKTALVTGIPESGLTNPSGGDRDSGGWRQERRMYYKNPTNIRASVRRFYNELDKADKGQSIPQLAQAVQRSGYPSRYAAAMAQAEAILNKGGVKGGGGSGGGTSVPGYTSTDTMAAARAALMSGTKNPLLDLASNLLSGGYDTKHPARTIPGPGGGGGSPQLGHGKVKLAAGANRAGVNVKPIVFNFLSGLGQSITIGTGTNHNRMTTSGNVSDHWDGHAADVPSSGAALTRLGQTALIRAGMKPSVARKQHGGAFTLNWHGHRVQIIFNSNIGGNHYNHLHVGIR